jgi:hypothetical protein
METLFKEYIKAITAARSSSSETSVTNIHLEIKKKFCPEGKNGIGSG